MDSNPRPSDHGATALSTELSLPLKWSPPHITTFKAVLKVKMFGKCVVKIILFPSLPTSLEKLTAVQAAVVQYIAQAMHSHTHTLTRLELQYASSQHLPCTF